MHRRKRNRDAHTRPDVATDTENLLQRNRKRLWRRRGRCACEKNLILPDDLLPLGFRTHRCSWAKYSYVAGGRAHAASLCFKPHLILILGNHHTRKAITAILFGGCWIKCDGIFSFENNTVENTRKCGIEIFSDSFKSVGYHCSS